MTRHARRSAFCLVALLSVVWPTIGQTQTAVLQQIIVGTPLTNFGRDTAVDGAFAIVGAPLENGLRGAAYVYTLAGGVWSPQQRLEASDATAAAQFGEAVAISGDTIIVGAPGAQTGGVAVGGAYIFVRSGNTWTVQGKLVASDAAQNAYFGGAVDVDGNTAVVGAAFAKIGGQRNGIAYIFDRVGATWTESRVLKPTPRADSDDFGVSVGVSGDTVCVGAKGVDIGATSNQGAAYVFVRTSGWTFQQQLTAMGGARSDGFGGSCAVDGNTIAVGAEGVDIGGAANFGAMYAFTRTGTVWSEQQRMSGDYAMGDATSVGLAGDLLVFGAPGERSIEGGTYVYRRSGAMWTRVQRIGNEGGVIGATFGRSVSTDGISILSGVPFASTGSGSPGNVVAVHTFSAKAGVPGAPTNVQASVNGSVLNLTWGAPSSGGAPTSYTLVARVSAGAPPLVTVPVGNVTGYSTPAPNGVFVLSVAASNASGTGPESAAVTVTIPSVPVAPGPPTNLTVGVAGDTATFTWAAPASGGAVANYVLVAGLTPGFSAPVASLPLPASSTTTAVPGIPPGTYYVRVVAQNAGGVSGATNEVALTVAGPSAPAAPTLNTPTVSGNTVTLSWTPGGGGAPTSYVLTARTPGGAVLATVPLTGSGVSFGGVPGGTYLLSLVAVNSVGASPPSTTVTLVVP